MPAVDVIEPVVRRRDLARGLGSRTSLDDEYWGGVECSGRDAAFGNLQAKVAEGGTLCVLSDGNIESFTLTPWFHARQLTVVGSSDCPDYGEHAAWLFPRPEARPFLLWPSSTTRHLPRPCPTCLRNWRRAQSRR